MKKIAYGIALAMVACMLALFVGCGSSNAGSSSASASSAASASASASASAGTPVDPANLTDGEYTVGVTLEGGSGRASVESPAKLTVAGEQKTVVIVWSSPNYDQMVIDGQQYWPVPRTGNSTFEIPLTAFDVDIPIQAETTAMSEPHMIDYTLRFDSSSLMK